MPRPASGRRIAAVPGSAVDAVLCGARDASVIERSTRCRHALLSTMTLRVTAANATRDAFSRTFPADAGAFNEYVPSAPDELASIVLPSPSTSVTATPGSGWRADTIVPAIAHSVDGD